VSHETRETWNTGLLFVAFTICYDSWMSTIGPQELQQNAEALLDRVEAGEHLLAIRGGRPVAELRPVAAARQSLRTFELCAGAFTAPDDFDASLPDDVLREFNGQ
jgi:antitoxin (DNA-binding transcriptional repressor) of toxin-antitoxin stability system